MPTEVAETRKIRTVLYGYGRVNQGVLELAALRPWMTIAGCIARTDRQADDPADDSGSSLFEV